ATPRISVEGRSFPRLRTAAQRGLFRLMRPFWFQQRRFHTELIVLLSQLTRELQDEREGRAASDTRVAQLGGELASAKRELGRIDRHYGRALQDGAQQLGAELQQVSTKVQ